MSKKIKLSDDLQKSLNSVNKNTVKKNNKTINQPKKNKVEKTPNKNSNHYQKIQKKVMEDAKEARSKKTTKTKKHLNSKTASNTQEIKLDTNNGKKNKNSSTSKSRKIIFTLKTSLLKFCQAIKDIFIKIVAFIKKNSKKICFGLQKVFKIIKFKIINIFKKEKSNSLKKEKLLKKEKKNLLSQKIIEFKSKKKINGPGKEQKDNLPEAKTKYEIINLDYPIIKSLTGRILPLTLTKWDRKRRKNIYLKEAILFSITLTLIDVYCFYNLSFMNILNVFDNSVWNLIATITLTLVILLFLSYLIDYLITESIVRKYQKNKEIR